MRHSEYSEHDLHELNAAFEQAHPQDILRWASESFGHDLALVTSFQPTGIVTLHMLQEIQPDIPVLTLDTGLLFDETYALIDTLQTRFNIKLKRVRPGLSLAEQAATYGDQLWQSDPDHCCHIRKTLPLQHALQGYTAWITGLRRDQSTGRASTPILSWDARNAMWKLCPFANWTEDMVWIYLRAYELPYNELHDRAYPSIGCHTCTHAVVGEGDVRAGRWAGREKNECGIHVSIEVAANTAESAR